MNTESKDMNNLQERWLSGEDVNWNELYLDKDIPSRMNLPHQLLEEKEIQIVEFHEEERDVEGKESCKEDGTNKERGLSDRIISLLCNILHMSELDVETDKAFAEYGLDSVKGAELIGALNAELKIVLSPTDIYDYPTTEQLADYIVNKYDVGKVDVNLKEEYVIAEEKQPIAIIGISGRFAESQNLEELWEHLEKGDNLVDKISKWDVEGYGSFIDNIEEFDPLFFNISGLEATYMDPQQRLFMEESWKALEDAGYAGKSIEGKKCGVFVGSTVGDYKDLFEGNVPAQALWGNMNAIIPTRMSYFLNLKGPAISVDTACSSSLVAIHLACQSIWNDESEMALAGGVFLQCTPKMFYSGNKGGMLSSTGCCHTFDESADGFVPGDGVGVVVLKSLTKAIEDHDNIYATIIGSGINQDGATNGITAPSSKAQEDLERSVYEKFSIDPNTIQMIEAHGTGTKLGDPIEVQALTRAFRSFTNDNNYCAIGSIKTNIGHAQHAAGIASIIKILLSFKHRKIPASLHYEKCNPNINFKESPFYVNTQLSSWKNENILLRAAASSFGFSGTNAHLVLEEVNIASAKHDKEREYLVALSAQTEKQLKVLVQNVINKCKSERIDCGNLSYTLLLGRRHFKHRLVCLVRDSEQLLSCLQLWISGNDNVAIYNNGKIEKRVEESKIKEGNDEIERFISQGMNHECLRDIGEKFCSGYDLYYDMLFSDAVYNKISLPVYPFLSEKYWIVENDKKVIHPLLQYFEKNDGLLQFKSLFSGEEFILKNHVVNSNHILPGSAYVEMFYTGAIYLNEAFKNCVRMKNITFIQPVTIENGDKDISMDVILKEGIETKFSICTKDHKKTFCEGTISSLREDELNSLEYLDKTSYERILYDKYAFYNELAKMGIVYGSCYQCIEEVYKNEAIILTKIILPNTVENSFSDYNIHPCMLDSVFQSIILAISQNTDISNVSPALLFSIGEMIVVGNMTKEIWALTIKADENDNKSMQKFDIKLFDNQGKNIINMQKVSAKTMPKVDMRLNSNENDELTYLVPRWKIEDVKFLEENTNMNGTLFLSSYHNDFIKVIEETCENVKKLYVVESDLDNCYVEQIKNCSNVTDVVWVESASNDMKGVKKILSFVKVLLKLGYGEKKLNWTILTIKAQTISMDQNINPYLAALHGFIGSMAKECRNWDIRLLDFEDEDIMAKKWNEAKNISFDKRGNSLVYRDENWFVQEMVPVKLNQCNKNGIAQNGIYIIVGGAGGLGYGLTTLLIGKYNATVIWLGRSKMNRKIEERITSFDMSNRPQYYSVDAADERGLRQIVDEIKCKYERINGVLHAAQVFYAASIDNVASDEYEKSLASKIDVAISLGKVFEKEKLDFLLFFSSINSYSKAPEQSAYSASCTFLDAYTKYLAQKVGYDVKVINWGYYKNNVEQASYLEKVGFLLLDEKDLLNGINTLLSEEFVQMSCVKVNSENAIRGLNLSPLEGKKINKKCNFDFNKKNVAKPSFSVEEVTANEKTYIQFENMLLELVCSELIRGLKFENGMTCEQLINVNNIKGFYQRWFVETIRILTLKEYFVNKGDCFYYNSHKTLAEKNILWENWEEAKKNTWCNSPELIAQVKLVESIIVNLIQIITGNVFATQIMFPDSSVGLLEDVYKTNNIGKYFNELLSCYVVEIIKGIIEQGDNEKIRILEIGAGTGGTSEVVFKKIKEFGAYIEEYCYTDISKAFLLHAEDSYRKDNPFLQCKFLNIEEEPHNQDFKEGNYDLVIASNCLHATKDICLSIRNAKSLLKENGVLLLNEMCGNNFFAHMTFGMLEGWWLYKDTYLRIEGCPGIYKNTWKNILLSEGLLDVYFPYDINYDAKQEIIISQSNGIICREKAILEYEAKQEKKEKIHKTENTNKATYDDAAITEKVNDELKVEIANALQIDANKIEGDRELSDYGVDSIISVNLISQFNNVFELELESTILFEYTTLNDLTQYIVDNFADKLVMKYNINISISNNDSYINENISFDNEIAIDNSSSCDEKCFAETFCKCDGGDEKIAIIGFSAKFPMADDTEEFWYNIVNNKKCFSKLSEERKELIITLSGEKIQSEYAGLISNIDEFNPKDFGLSDEEAVLYCPEFRLLLMYVQKAIEDAGITSKKIKKEKIGLFISANQSDYKTSQNGKTKIFTNMSGSLMANQISYILNLNGPSECCETGCSSAIVAIHRAGQALKNGECDIAIVAAVNLLLSGDGFANMEELGLLSDDGDAKPFQNDANGFVRSEGVGAIVLKKYVFALESHCNICSIIKGSAVGHGGRSASFATPGLSGMRDIIIDAYKKSNISFQDIDYIEAHGIGNSISDSIEIGAIKSAYKELNGINNDLKKIVISCLKPNIGHGEIFSGIAAIIKVILAMRNKIIPGIIDFTDIADAINLDDTPFTINNQNSKWEKVNGEARLASINSYGLGGVNAHLVLEEYKESRVSENKKGVRLFVISANTKEDLYQSINNLIIHLKEHKYDLADIEYTLKMGRNMLKERFAVIAEDEQQLIERMEVFLETKKENDEFLFYGKIDEKETVLNKFFSDDIKKIVLTTLQEKKNLKKLALYWTNIDDIDWEIVSEKENAKIVSLPPYPYVCKSYWYTSGNVQSNINDCELQGSTKLIEIIRGYVGVKDDELDRNKTLKDYGVDSIRIIPLLQKLQRITSSNISLKDIGFEQTINEIIIKLEKSLSKKGNCYMDTMNPMNNYSELVKLNSIEKGNPIFWIHAALGGVEPYIKIADEINRPFWGIQARGWLTDKEPIKGINEMAAYYTQIIQSVQPEGPYDIGGFCLGGILAYEVTRLLQGRGYKVNTLVMIDSPDNTFQHKMLETPQGNDAKGIIFQTVNMLLYSQLKDSENSDKFFIAYKELNLKVTDEEFISQVSKLAISHGLFMKEEEIVNILKNNIAVQSSYLLHMYKINSLHKKNEVKCFYFRNIRGVFEGSLRKYICLPNNKFNFDNQIYWEEWKQEISNIEIIDVDATSHMTLLNETGSMKVILDKCKEVY